MSRAQNILSIQSHVVHGYVGNRAAVFPLQLLGFEVDVINSVQFSCHTGYPAIKGQKLQGDDLAMLAQGLAANDVLDHTHLLTGYTGAPSFLREVLSLLRKLPKSCRYVCDPVLGDNGKLYVPEELVSVYREEVLPLVSVLTPNQFEAELLAQRHINNLSEAAAVCDLLHSHGPETIVITSMDTPDATVEGEFVAMLLSQAGRSKWLLRLPFIAGGPFTGTGDLTAAMILAWTQLCPHEAPEALEKTGAVVQAVLQKTVSLDVARIIGGKCVPPELRILGSKRAIEEPCISMRCRLLEDPNILGIILDMDCDAFCSGEDRPAGCLLHGTRDLVERLSGAGLRLGAASSRDAASTTAALQKIGLQADRFCPIITVDLGLPPKPDSAPVLRCCTAWGLQPASVLVVAGCIDGLRCGQTAGSRTAALLQEHPDALESNQDLAEAAEFASSSLEVMLQRLFPKL